ncbi:hypothetical protein C6P46_003056 [Rhodotorula mucilaginosa]|uniref:PPPDE domain-containing protein n=1 Tax=Rhodotorula mucilaginosa TaxID=5537 RepID=A0A9P6W5B2_RHOMI|nr:hypothetical protein C6P46_003056 [Rhodotorula mucilaginosa]TKA53119.1 hypothetical protein B0A53_03999 [Rhodotorula sp. CCFEE 5036]
MARSSGEQPLGVQVVVYDLLPPSKLGSLLNLFGTGVYHSSVQLALPLGPTDHDPTPAEYAFGGHDSPGTTGIFSIPAGTAVQRMPGLRYYMTIDAGEAFGKDWERAFRGGADGTLPPTARPRSAAEAPPSAESWSIAATTTGSNPYRTDSIASDTRSSDQLSTCKDSLGSGANPDASSDDDDDGGARDGTQYMTRAERRAFRILEAMKRDPEWYGTKYRLLERNCNTFTHEVVWRLTGRRAPAWLNRAAWVATAIPCIVPAGWIDDADEAAPTAADSDSHSQAQAHIPDPGHLLSGSDTVTIAPPRADRMSASGRE